MMIENRIDINNIHYTCTVLYITLTFIYNYEYKKNIY